MKSTVRSILFLAILSFFVACSNGDYVANPASNANGSINPLHPLAAGDFNWANNGTNPMSADINGTHWIGSGYTYGFDSGLNTIVGYNGSKAIVLVLTDPYAGNLFNMGYGQYNTMGYYTDSLGDTANYYYSVLGNSGGLEMLVYNDTIGIKGLFYFQGVNRKGAVVNITHGYFSIPLP
jgi:hypothetical protein